MTNMEDMDKLDHAQQCRFASAYRKLREGITSSSIVSSFSMKGTVSLTAMLFTPPDIVYEESCRLFLTIQEYEELWKSLNILANSIYPQLCYANIPVRHINQVNPIILELELMVYENRPLHARNLSVYICYT